MSNALFGSLPAFQAATASRLALLQDVVHDGTDSTVVRSPLPRGISPLMRVMFNMPAWMQITGVVLGLAIAGIIIWLLWRRREAIFAWLGTRSRNWKIGLTAAGALVVAGAGAVGFAGYDYMEHDNGFCVSCHVMGSAWTRFQESEHRKLECHQCHRQGMVANARQLYYWVAERPDRIPPHAKVPTRICEECHMQQQAGDSAWKRILATGGHAVHMRNDDPKLKGVECVTCHGAEVHHFTTVAKTCGQKGCHDDVRINLGKMASQTSMHCTQCHDFGRRAPEGVSPDSARLATIPVSNDCFGCHQMRQKLESFDPAREPHKAVCGTCHNPHKQTAPEDAWKTCTASGCHSKPDTLTPFHRGIAATTLSNCGNCHKAHTWRVQGGNCQACHKGAFGRHPQAEAAAPMHSDPARRPARASGASDAPSAALAPPGPSGGPGGAVPDDWIPAGRRPHGPMPDLSELPAQGLPPAPAVQSRAPARPQQPVAASPASAPQPPVAQRPVAKSPARRSQFPHDRHTSIACHACHAPGEAHGKVIIRAPQDCDACHHSTRQRAVCTECHSRNEIAAPREITVAARTSVFTGTRDRTLTFRHELHASLQCRSCHGDGTSLGNPRSCTSCHESHHQQARNCSSCHATPLAEHARQTAHQGCATAGCHQDVPVAALEPSRNVCLVCHREQTDHKPGRDCATCHLVSWRGASSQAGAGR